jgi:RNA polymerase sigma factor (TIGR02999 family)
MEHGWTDAMAGIRSGLPGAPQALYGLVYEQLHRLARRIAPGATLTPTALVHEAFIKLLGAEAGVADRSHFMALAARAMRQIAIDHARRGAALRRQQEGAAPGEPGQLITEEVLAVHSALERLEALDPRLARTVELRYFGGFTEEEIAEVTGLTVRTVRRDWRKARAFLFEEVRGALPADRG